MGCFDKIILFDDLSRTEIHVHYIWCNRFMDMWLSWHHLSTCAKSLVSDVTTTSKDLLWVDSVVSSAKMSANECDRT